MKEEVWSSFINNILTLKVQGYYSSVEIMTFS